MTGKRKPPTKKATGKVKLKKETLRDLDASKTSGGVKGGGRDPHPPKSRQIACYSNQGCP